MLFNLKNKIKICTFKWILHFLRQNDYVKPSKLLFSIIFLIDDYTLRSQRKMRETTNKQTKTNVNAAHGS